MVEHNKEIVRRFGELCLGKGELRLVGELVGDDVVDHNALPGQGAGRAGIIDAILLLRAAFPDLHVVAEALVGDGELVAARWSMSGTHLGEFAGIPASGRNWELEGMDLYRIEDRRIVEIWPHFDTADLLRQLGA